MCFDLILGFGETSLKETLPRMGTTWIVNW